MALSLDTTHPGTYRQRGTSSLQRLFRAHFPQLSARYEAEFARRLSKFRLERICKAVQRFIECGDYSKGIARIQCTNPRCKAVLPPLFLQGVSPLPIVLIDVSS